MLKLVLHLRGLTAAGKAGATMSNTNSFSHLTLEERLMELFELYRAGGLTCKVVEYAVYAFDFVYYSGHDFV